MSLHIFGYHCQAEGEGAWMTKSNYSQSTFMWTVTNSLSVFSWIQYCLGFSLFTVALAACEDH